MHRRERERQRSQKIQMRQIETEVRNEKGDTGETKRCRGDREINETDSDRGYK